MSDEKSNFDKALAEWRVKHGIRDDDSVLQMLELLKIVFQNVKIELPELVPISKPLVAENKL